LVDARIKAGLGQENLADRLKCHQSLVARLESGERRIDVVELVGPSGLSMDTAQS
jgi:ribosome-binding protein aMBF1 (putative translation factor)